MTEGYKRTPLLWSIAGLALLAVLAGLAGLDQLIAERLGPDSDPLAPLVAALDAVALKDISNFLLGALLLVVAAIAMAMPPLRAKARLLLYVGAVQFASTTVTDLAKPLFGRLRPSEALAAGQNDAWFLGANSFPSGHVGFYAGLVFPIVAIWPKAWPVIIVPLLVAAQRMLSLDHYLSDVSASLAVAALLAVLLRPMAKLNAIPAGGASARSR